ncbi:hepatocellular carcinoma-associated antigen 59-domain-containing protein [Mycotypha africana]|uniref:hepatocellular carcinoma-associated antigen 59-domain-containing protein n=1 Tax=Mycotypha africana TaxID=64632 RepID=UPI002301747A|nr:hepatocellular carcinoma-associated antigen 59-domain-containing protein [Mycotypha africana]KAI8990802.1 hepatocellular carcinoma-associated antigen 59-domain-containing protein [Mycotypha africana]
MAIIKKQKQYRKKKVDSDSDEQEVAVEQTEEEISSTIEELEELRRLRRKRKGIDAEKLLKGAEKKSKKKKADDSSNGWNLKTGGLVPSVDQYKAKVEEGEEVNSTAKKLKLDAFATATNTLDVDKHMMEYIENEMKKRRGGNPDQAQDDEDENENNEHKGLVDIYEELYRIPDRLKTEKKPESEGNVQLSTQMLTAIPEVDLGIDTRLKNIEETEKAKRKLLDETEKEELQGHQPDRTQGNYEKHIPKQFKPRLGHVLRATDEQAVARFKKRMRK